MNEYYDYMQMNDIDRSYYESGCSNNHCGSPCSPSSPCCTGPTGATGPAGPTGATAPWIYAKHPTDGADRQT